MLRHRDLYLTTHDIQKRQTSMPTARFEPAITASVWAQTHALDRMATGIGRAILQKSVFPQVLEKYTDPYGTRRFGTVRRPHIRERPEDQILVV
jgi:hypothetical protein